MSIGKERLEKIISWAETYGSSNNVMLPAEEAAEMACAMLEMERLRAQEPRKLYTCSGCGREGLDEPPESRCDCMEDGATWFESALYAEPKPLTVPDEWTIQDAVKFCRETGRQDAGSAMDAFNHCRAAMLQSRDGTLIGEGTMRNSNSPEIPDRWIPCSERMPPPGGSEQRYVLAADFKNHYSPSIPNTQIGVYGDWFNDGNPTWDDGDGEDLRLKEVTHWMELPAAPTMK